MSSKRFSRIIEKMALAAAIGVLAIGGTARASIIEADKSTTTDGAYNADIVANDLINTGAASLASSSGSQATVVGTFAGTHDGVGNSGVSGSNCAFYMAPWPVTLTYTLGGSATGYDISKVNFFSGWAQSTFFSNQKWDLQVATKANPTFTTLWSVDYSPFASETNSASSGEVTLTDSTGRLATGVTALQFIVDVPSKHNATPASVGVLISEIDVIGSASPVPEPSTLALLAAGLFSLLAYAWRKHG